MFEWIAGAAGLAAAGMASYGAIAPESGLFGKTLHRLADPKQLALTYDDGPNDPHTLNLLDVLAKHDGKATFFLTGQHLAPPPEARRRSRAPPPRHRRRPRPHRRGDRAAHHALQV